MLTRWPQGSPWLFPGLTKNPDGTRPYAHASLSYQLGDWQARIDVRDEAGQRVRVHAHQFRHTVGTRLTNQRWRAPRRATTVPLAGHVPPSMRSNGTPDHSCSPSSLASQASPAAGSTTSPTSGTPSSGSAAPDQRPRRFHRCNARPRHHWGNVSMRRRTRSPDSAPRTPPCETSSARRLGEQRVRR